ncbi:DUF4333 domain-containing protein [Frondihabitans cladoniiphilus]|uniref:DUF2510 domain-containing protein n=1 Tax=Frondihabitans cladoniiphilus TaxID=715785 RepID=A0ABP8VZK8_9MICO
MSDISTVSPVPGWYPDPTSAAPYRWWDGDQWTRETLADAPAETPGPTASSGSTEALLPTRRSLREATREPERAPIRPGVVQGVPHSPGRGFTPPAAWVAHAPAYPPAPASLVPTRAFPPGGPTLGPAPTNRPSRLALTFVLFAVLGLGVMGGVRGYESARTTAPGSGASILVAVVALVVVGLLLASLPLAVVGIVRGNELARWGLPAIGRTAAIVALVLAGLYIVGATPSFVSGLEHGLAARNAAAKLGIDTGLGGTGLGGTGLGGTPLGGAPGSSGAQGTGDTFAELPQVAVVSPSGDGSYVYSQAQAQSALSQAYAATLKASPASVACPAAEPVGTSISFECTVTLAGGTVTSATVTELDEQGHVQIQAH